jgi:muramoyltetrapeptide carboxypeptidase LdcA involved in peptidoglycan recycling
MTWRPFRNVAGPHLVPPKLTVGDRVAVLSPSWAGPLFFPEVFDLGLARLRSELGLVAVEYPSTRDALAPAERAVDLNEAWADPSIKAVIASIGGEDEIKVLRHLDRDVLATNPKAFVGYSDNTNLLLYLWNLGIVGFHGGSVMVHLARPGRMHETTLASLRAALFDGGSWELGEPATFGDEDSDWASVSPDHEPPMRKADPWSWHGPARKVTGPAWGGDLEIIDLHLRAGRWLLDLDSYNGAVLVIETSEALPSAKEVYRILMGMGERGLLQRFAAVLVGRAKAWSLARPLSRDERERYAADQRAAVLRAITEYMPGDGDNPGVPVVFNLDIGHTDPQIVVPMGGLVTVDLVEARIAFEY